MENNRNIEIYTHTTQPDFSDLPWTSPISSWKDLSPRLEEVTHGISRHLVVFINYGGLLFAVKELPWGLAEKEYESLRSIAEQNLPAVSPVGYVSVDQGSTRYSALITQYLENSIPYRSLFMSPGLFRYRDHLLDAISALLVELHLSGIFWGDCSLSNTLFRRDAGALQAYLVDAETTEVFPQKLPPALRYQELEIMEENIDGELADLRTLDNKLAEFPIQDTGGHIKLKYQRLWEEITHEDIINPGEQFRIQERIRSLNLLGYSVGDISLVETDSGNQLRYTVVVSDRNFHRNQLFNLTGIEAEERQARYLLNEIQEIKAVLTHSKNRSTPTSVAAHYWLENNYYPTIEKLLTLNQLTVSAPELYCQILEHKWFLSEKAQRDVGHQFATQDYMNRFVDTFPSDGS